MAASLKRATAVLPALAGRIATNVAVTKSVARFQHAMPALKTAADIDPKSYLDFTGKVVFITGGSSGIGKATAIAFAKAGAKGVVIADWTDASPVVKEINTLLGRQVASYVKTDVSKDGDVEAAVKTALDRHGRLDVAFNNAGIIHDTLPFNQITPEVWGKVMGVNTNGVYHCMRHQVPAMIKCGGGAIINTASIAGLATTNNLSAYVASKHAVIGLSKAVAQDHAKDKIRVNVLAPGSVMTGIATGIKFTAEAAAEMTPNVQKRGADPAELAPTVLALASEQMSSFVTGATVVVDGGHFIKF